jgi:two-component system sensor histidine kinase/response regulator
MVSKRCACRMRCPGNIPAVVMVTAFGREEAMAKLERKRRAHLAHGMLTKPVMPSTLLEAIGETLHKGMQSQPAARRARPNGR